MEKEIVFLKKYVNEFLEQDRAGIEPGKADWEDQAVRQLYEEVYELQSQILDTNMISPTDVDGIIAKVFDQYEISSCSRAESMYQIP
jgi:hypothetical protein